MEKKYKDAIVYSSYGYVAADDGMVPGNGLIFFHSFNTGKNLKIGYRRSTCIPDFQPNRARILYAAEDKLFDAGQYGLYDTLEDKLLFEDIVGSVGFHDGFLYLISGGVFKFPLNEPSKLKKVTTNILKWYKSSGKDIITKRSYDRQKQVIANGVKYTVKNSFPSFHGSLNGKITDPKDVPIVISPTWIDDLVSFPEDIILAKTKMKEIE